MEIVGCDVSSGCARRSAERRSGSAYPINFLISAGGRPRSRAAQAKGDVGREKAELRARIIGLAVEAHAVERLRRRQLDHGVGKLDFAASAFFALLQKLENLRIQNVATEIMRLLGAVPCGGFSIMPLISKL